jgi:hypothetical protein
LLRKGPFLRHVLCVFHDADLQGVYTEPYSCSPSKSSKHDESERPWRNAAGFRDQRPYSSQTLAREYAQGTRIVRENNFPVLDRKLEGANTYSGPTYNMMNGCNGPTLEEIVSERRKSNAEKPITSGNSIFIDDTEPPYEDQIELNKFMVRGSGGDEEIRTGHKMAWSPGHRNSHSGELLTSHDPNFVNIVTASRGRVVREFSREQSVGIIIFVKFLKHYLTGSLSQKLLCLRKSAELINLLSTFGVVNRRWQVECIRIPSS